MYLEHAFLGVWDFFCLIFCEVRMVNITINAELSEEEALALAQFVKRIDFSQFRALAVSDEEAYLMQYAAAVIGRSLADAGYCPR